jgi:hypothetical protein|uniref:Uncharacterized protein n=1 Tax=viral metagenome TaxID=1070528 RepID=A0A6C0IRQ0_9ZZZZ
MEVANEAASASNKLQQSGGGFVGHVFSMNNDNKNELFNLVQYLVIIVIPLMFFNNLIDDIIPPLNEKKGHLELVIEVIGHSLLILGLIYLLHRIVTYIPTHSGRAYDSLSLLSLLLAVIMFNSKIVKKSKELFNRAKIAWEGKEEPKKTRKNIKQRTNSNIVSVSQPISSGVLPPTVPTHQVQKGNGYVEQFQQMTAPQATNQPTPTMQSPQQGFQNTQPPAMSNEPMAANDGFGAFSSF